MILHRSCSRGRFPEELANSDDMMLTSEGMLQALDVRKQLLNQNDEEWRAPHLILSSFSRRATLTAALTNFGIVDHVGPVVAQELPNSADPKVAGITCAGDLTFISAKAMPWHTTWWWLDQAGSTCNKLRTPSESLQTGIQVTIAIPHHGAGKNHPNIMLKPC